MPKTKKNRFRGNATSCRGRDSLLVQTARHGITSKYEKVLCERGFAENGMSGRGLVQAYQRCDYCLQSPLYNRYGVYEALLCCTDCKAKAHPSCMEYSEELSARARRGPWQCIDCKICCLCHDAGDPALMLFCDGCDKGYHTNCHVPPVLDNPSGKWVCQACTREGVVAEELERKEVEQKRQTELCLKEEQQLMVNSTTPLLLLAPQHIKQEAEPSVLPLTPALSPFVEYAGCKPQFLPVKEETAMSSEPRFTSDSAYPDATNWTITDVFDFFVSAGFLEQAEAFREQEIDGKSLLLMKRNDVLTGMSIKLGPALKIHRHVQGLQLASSKASSSRV